VSSDDGWHAVLARIGVLVARSSRPSFFRVLEYRSEVSSLGAEAVVTVVSNLAKDLGRFGALLQYIRIRPSKLLDFKPL